MIVRPEDRDRVSALEMCKRLNLFIVLRSNDSPAALRELREEREFLMRKYGIILRNPGGYSLAPRTVSIPWLGDDEGEGEHN